MTQSSNYKSQNPKTETQPQKGAKPETIMGWRIAPPRLTLAAYIAGLKYVALPILAALALLDGVLYLFFDKLLGRCYGLWCLI